MYILKFNQLKQYELFKAIKNFPTHSKELDYIVNSRIKIQL